MHLRDRGQEHSDRRPAERRNRQAPRPQKAPISGFGDEPNISGGGSVRASHPGPICLSKRPCLWREGEELARYRELDEEADTNPAIPVFCVVGRGYWWFKPNEPSEKWMNHLANEEHDEVIDFIGGVANTVPDQILLKGRPRFGNYIIRPRELRDQ